MSKRVAAVVLAGGLGTRLRSVLPDLPKPMAPVAGRPFIEWVVRYLVNQGICDVVISTGYRAEVFEEHFAANAIPGLRSISCVAEPHPLGTAGGFLFAAGSSTLRPDAWLVLNGDSLALADLSPLLHCPAPGGLLALRVDDASRYGSVEIDAAGHLTRFSEKRPGASWINAGVYLFADDLLDQFPTREPLSFEVDVFPSLLASGWKIAAIQTEAPFLDIGLPETLELADGFVRQNGERFSPE